MRFCSKQLHWRLNEGLHIERDKAGLKISATVYSEAMSKRHTRDRNKKEYGMITERQWNKMVIEADIQWYLKEGYDVVVSLNCKSGVTREEIVKAARIMWNKIDCMAFGKANVKRRGMRLKRRCMLDVGITREKEIGIYEMLKRVQIWKNKDNIDIKNIDIKYIEEKKASTNNTNLHYHCSVKSGGSFESAQKLVDEIDKAWKESGIAGNHSKIEVYDSAKGNGWFWYCAKKESEGMECLETSVR